MSQRDGFTGGFLTGVILGGIVGGIVGALAASRRSGEHESRESSSLDGAVGEGPELSEASMEHARRSLEHKIAQLNLAIDDVREQLSSVNGNYGELNHEETAD
ncbi:hypothetical protein K4A83_06915 [Spirulina subsalsa FACHB-351]|uniref:Gas vesicle protein n=1 Tax=Spirulina subsalsa FACHB-351 TaxID=234711 RepID=A0ABT3L3B7_9CYAN|nr:hypothetical protein [Spirulina subsalsa]MCW6036003.1 hypothetical protein [Spirulina subsalsa FACHB-351]